MADAKTRAKFRERNSDPKQQEHRRNWNRRNPAVMRKISAKQRSTRPDHIQARREAAKEGKPASHKCARCGAPAVAAHHTSYNPPRHVWLCKTHHDAAHTTRPNVRRTKAKQAAKSLFARSLGYGKGTAKTFAGFPVRVETPAGSYRQWGPREHQRTLMQYDYGYIEGVDGADGDEYDCYLGPDESSPFVFVIHQVVPDTGEYDEDKAMIGWSSAEEALEAYRAHYDRPGFDGCIAQLTVAEFREKLMSMHDGMVKGDKIPGGLADKKKPVDFPPGALAQGVRVEMEHTSDPKIAKEIAMDHLMEDLQYYEKLKRVEGKESTSKSASSTPTKPPAEYAREGAKRRSDYADPKNYKYPLHTEANVRAAHSYFSMPKNRVMYSEQERSAIQSRINRAARKYGINISKSLPDAVVEFFHANPQPSDEQVHAFALDHGMDYEEFEEYLFELIGEAVASKSLSKSDSYSVPTSVRAAARRGLEYRKKAGGQGGLDTKQAAAQGIGSGVQRASNLIQGSVTKETIKRMHAFFSRHQKNKGVAPGKQPWEDRGHVAWLIWGGDPGRAWAAKMVAQFEREEA